MDPAIARIQAGNPVKGSSPAVAEATSPFTPCFGLDDEAAGATPPEDSVVVVPRTVVVVVELVLGVVVEVLGVVVVVVDVAQSSFPASRPCLLRHRSPASSAW